MHDHRASPMNPNAERLNNRIIEYGGLMQLGREAQAVRVLAEIQKMIRDLSRPADAPQPDAPTTGKLEWVNEPTNAALDRKAAECLGWRLAEPGDGYVHWNWRSERDEYLISRDAWRPTTNRDQAALLEAEVERRGVKRHYVQLLFDAVRAVEPDVAGEMWPKWKLITAPPAARVAAAVQVLAGHRDE